MHNESQWRTPLWSCPLRLCLRRKCSSSFIPLYTNTDNIVLNRFSFFETAQHCPSHWGLRYMDQCTMITLRLYFHFFQTGCLDYFFIFINKGVLLQYSLHMPACFPEFFREVFSAGPCPRSISFRPVSIPCISPEEPFACLLRD